jgi:hypothetical protein
MFPGPVLSNRYREFVTCKTKVFGLGSSRPHLRTSISDTQDTSTVPENNSSHWVQRRISFKTAEYVGIGSYISKQVREINDFDIGIAHLHVQTPGLGLRMSPLQSDVDSRVPSSQFVSTTISKGRLSLGQGFSSDVFVSDLQDPNPASSSLYEALGNESRVPRVVELLVTLQGVRRADTFQLARPASHVSGQPRPGDSLSPIRADALRVALRSHGLDLDALLSSPDYQASSARRTCHTFINPRSNRVPNRIEPLEQSAARCAQQVRPPCLRSAKERWTSYDTPASPALSAGCLRAVPSDASAPEQPRDRGRICA